MSLSTGNGQPTNRHDKRPEVVEIGGRLAARTQTARAMRSAALATAIALLTRSDHAGAAEIAVDQGDGTMCAGDFCFPAPPTPFVSSLSPAHGPLDGGTDVVVVGSGFRDFGELMRCRFGTQKMSASLSAPEGEFIDATNHYQVGCHTP